MDDPVEESVLCEQHDGVAVLTLNRPNVINAVNTDVRQRLAKVLPELDDDETIKVIVLHGAGDRGFCAGADIKEARPKVTAIGERNRLMPTSWIETLDGVRKPVIAALHGICMGAGLELALACDIRIAAKGSRFALPETKLGLIPGGGGTQRLARIVGVGRALEMILVGDEMDARAALAMGLVNQLTDTAEAALTEAIDVAKKLGRRAPLALAYAKESVRAGSDLSLAAGLSLEKSLFAILAEQAARAKTRTVDAERATKE